MSRSQFSQYGTLLGDRAVSADSGGYAQLEVWAQELGRVEGFGIEGTGSYGAGLTRLGATLRASSRGADSGAIGARATATVNLMLSMPKLLHGRSLREPRPRFPRPRMGW